MNNSLMKAKTGLIISKEGMNSIKKGGRYGCIALGIYALHDLCIRAMEKDYAFNCNLDPKGSISFNFTPNNHKK